MLDQHFPPSTDVFGPLENGERALWRGRAGVAEYAFDQAASLPRWTLPETTELLITDRRVIYAYASDERELEVTSGELRWFWPQHLRVQPGALSSERGAAATQIQLVCASGDGSFPALVFAGGDLFGVGDADKVANVLRQAIARFRVDNAELLGVSAASGRMLSRLLIGPEFSNYQGGEGQTVTLQGALLVTRPAPVVAEVLPAVREVPARRRSADSDAPARRRSADSDAPARRHSADSDAPARRRSADSDAPAESVSPEQLLELLPARRPATRRAPAAEGTRVIMPVADGTRVMTARPGIEADATRAWEAARAEQATQHEQPDLASRAAVLAARVADMVCAQVEPEPTAAAFEVPTTNLPERAEVVRRSAARFTANSAGTRVGSRRADREAGVTTQGNRNA